MKEKILYIYGYGSNPKDSSTMKVVKEVVEELGYELVSVEYDQSDPDMSLNRLEAYCERNGIKYVIGHSLGGFIALCMDSIFKRIVINPCMKPQYELPKLGPVDPKTLYEYEYLDEWLRGTNETPWVRHIEDVMGLFGEDDELFSYYVPFRKIYPTSYLIKAGHRPTKEAFTEDIKKKIKEFLS